MKRRLAITVAVGAALAIGGLIGFAAGFQAAWRQGQARAQQEVVGALARQVETLARLRTADHEGAIEILENSMDRGVVTALESGLKVDRRTLPTLSAVKLYRSVYPSTGEVDAALEPLPQPDLRFCSPTLQALAAMNPADRGLVRE